MDDDDIFARTTHNRMLIADLLESLSAEQWDAPTLCAGWSVRRLAGHLLQPMLVGFGRFFLTAVRHRGNTEATVDQLARMLADRPPAESVSLLRQHAHDRVRPPRVGPMGPFAETCVHLRDIARPLGLEADVPRADWVTLLDYLTTREVAPALVAPRRLEGIALTATDAARRWGSGLEVWGPAEGLAMVVTGRTSVASDLNGPGLPRLLAMS
ncbi:maleylpyruvate isomerase family mycothiol-dependent enzyme [Nocardioides sp. STR2]|uniref:Maleylpyruvate isomerase family mycothiol-dependent enzyme n=1 Tax=Nocardioides pini TaxID=2975053 RepID=A0ABT4CCH2_9ACTN|nr:maleylpyruvate isomerase family mycothiol-dependent enzyme [Nocardioides pini]MCY4725592.1 maleylpyruvate isomerase family mycothiol-dependent enzyme [Nocardioides pini]